LDSLLVSSKGLLSTLVTSQKSDTWYLETTFYLLIVTIGWLVFRRFLYGPLWWLVWLPTKLLYRLVFTVLGILGVLNKGAAADSSVAMSLSSTGSSIAPSASIMASSQPNKQDEAVNTPLKEGQDPSPDGSESQKVGQMAEEARKQDEKPVKLRGDGTPLVDSDAPRNPKKRVLYEPPAGEKDEL
jgi:protein transport protein SEC20